MSETFADQDLPSRLTHQAGLLRSRGCPRPDKTADLVEDAAKAIGGLQKRIQELEEYADEVEAAEVRMKDALGMIPERPRKPERAAWRRLLPHDNTNKYKIL